MFNFGFSHVKEHKYYKSIEAKKERYRSVVEPQRKIIFGDIGSCAQFTSQ